VLGAIGGTVYNLVLLVHLIAVIVGAGMAFLAPIFMVRFREFGGQNSGSLVETIAGTVVFPGLLVAGIAGGALVGLSDDQLDFGMTWLTVAGPLWLISLGLSLVAYPSLRMNVFNPPRELRRLARIGLHVVLLLLLVDMVWKP